MLACYYSSQILYDFQQDSVSNILGSARQCLTWYWMAAARKILQMCFYLEKIYNLTQISSYFILCCLAITDQSTVVPAMACHRTGNKPLP